MHRGPPLHKALAGDEAAARYNFSSLPEATPWEKLRSSSSKSATCLRLSWRSSADGLPSSTPRSGTDRSRPTRRPESLIASAKRLFGITPKAGPSLFEPPHHAGLLGVLRTARLRYTSGGRSSVRSPERQPTPPIAPFQEGGAILVSSSRDQPSSFGGRE